MFAEDSYIFSVERHFDGWAPGILETACDKYAPKKEEEERMVTLPHASRTPK